MPTPEFKYYDPCPTGEDKTTYYRLTNEYVSASTFEGKEVLKIDPQGLTLLAQRAMKDVSFLLRSEHLEQMSAILNDPEASDNDKYVALTLIQNAVVSGKGKLPYCQDTGTATIFAKKGQQVWTDCNDAEALSLGIYKTYTDEYLDTLKLYP